MFLLSQNNNIVTVYAALILAIFMNFIPSLTIQSWGGVLFLITFLVTYIFKFNTDKESFDYNHYSYITKTIWIFSLFSFIGIILAYLLGDHTLINQLVNDIKNGTIPTNQDIFDVTMAYGRQNILLFAVIFLPITFYLLYRLGKGVHLARQNKIIPNLKSWI